MAGNRKAATAYIVENIDKLLPGSENKQRYLDMFDKMSDKDFDAFMKRLESGEEELCIIAPNMNKNKLDLKRNFALAKELGHDFYERIWINDRNTGTKYLSPIKYMIVDLPLRRQAQLLTKKISIPTDNRSIDYLSGQPTGKSKGAKISYPEVQIMAAMGLDKSLIELMKYRGGDLKGFNAMNASIARAGGVSLDALDQLGTKVKSTQTLSTILTGMHLGVSGLDK